MVLETLSQSPISIKNLVIDPSQPATRFFDPTRELSARDWDQAIYSFETFNIDRSLPQLFKMAADTKILSPVQYSNLRFMDEWWNALPHSINLTLGQQFRRMNSLMELLGHAAVIDRDRLMSLPLDFSKIQQTIVGDLKFAVNHDGYCQWATGFKLTFPDQEIPGVADSRWKAEDKLLRMRRENDWGLAETSAAIRLIHPDLLEKHPLGAGEWKTLRLRFQKYKQEKRWLPIVSEAFGMTLLSADWTRLSERGIEFGNNTTFPENSNTGIPAMRKF